MDTDKITHSMIENKDEHESPLDETPILQSTAHDVEKECNDAINAPLIKQNNEKAEKTLSGEDKNGDDCISNKIVSPARSCHSVATSHVTFDMKSLERNPIVPTRKEGEVCTVDEEANCNKCSAKIRKGWGWVVVVASWITMIPIAGTLASFGTLVESLGNEFNATKLETGWIASLAFSFTVGTCPVSTPLFTVFGGRKVALFGTISGSVSVLITSFTPTIYLMFLTYSAMFGISANFVYNSAMSLTGQYFPSKYQALATCLASAGISFGTLLMNPFAEFLVSAVGWRNTLRVLSVIILVVGLPCVSTFRPVKTFQQKLVTKLKHTRNEEREKVMEIAMGSHKDLDKQAITESLQNCNESRISLAAQEIKKNVFDKRMYDCSVCSSPAFILWMLGTLFWSLSFLFPIIFLIDYMGTIGIPPSTGALVMTAYGISEFCGRIICAAFADKIPFSLAYVYAISCGFMGVATLLAPQASSLWVMFLYAVAVGVNSGVLNSLMFTTTMQLFGNQRGTHVWGYINVMLALGMVIGPVTAGGLYDITESYTAAFYLGGGMFVISAITMLLIPIVQRYFPQAEREARGKRECEVPTSAMKRIVKPRSSLRSVLITQQLKSKPKWKSSVANELRALDELHSAYEDGVDRNDNNVSTMPEKEADALL